MNDQCHDKPTWYAEFIEVQMWWSCVGYRASDSDRVGSCTKLLPLYYQWQEWSGW